MKGTIASTYSSNDSGRIGMRTCYHSKGNKIHCKASNINPITVLDWDTINICFYKRRASKKRMIFGRDRNLNKQYIDF